MNARLYIVMLTVAILSGCSQPHKDEALPDSLTIDSLPNSPGAPQTQRAETPDRNAQKQQSYYSHPVLGFRFPIGWDEWVSLKRPSTEQWRTYTDSIVGVTFRYPTDAVVSIQTQLDHELGACSPLLRVSFGGETSVKIFRTSLSLRYILQATCFDYVPFDSDGFPVLEFLRDSTSSTDSGWVSLGRQGMEERAVQLDGPVWHGLRGHNYMGFYYSEAYTKETGMSGYAGLGDFILITVLRQDTSDYGLACVFRQYPVDVMTEDEEKKENAVERYGEAEFYEIVASLKPVRLGVLAR